MIRQHRIEKLVNSLKREGVDAVLVGASADLEYLTGLNPSRDERFKGFIVMNDGRYFYICPSLYYEETRKCIGEDVKIYVWNDAEGFLTAVEEANRDYNLDGRTIAVNASILAIDLLDIKKIINAKFVKGNMILGELRIIKDEEEIKNLKKAALIIDDVMGELIKLIEPGLLERDIRDKVEELCKERGGAELSFSPIIASGPNGSMPHYNDDSREIQKNDVVLMDIGCKYNGYCSDITRTVFVGEPTKEQKEVYEVCLKANLEAEKFAKPGVLAEEVDLVARRVIEDAGLGDYFITRTGHGIGMEVHEQPNIVVGNRQVLKPGMAFSIEPSICIPDRFGIRIEDIVVVREDGLEILNEFPKELIIV